MSITRRQFVQTAAATGALTGTLNPLLTARALQPASAGTQNKRVLILGGTRFLGPALVHACIARDWSVTLFNRGRSNPDLFPNLETIIGDRDPDVGQGLKGLEGREWDAVIDTSGYVPRIARASAELLADHVGQYVFVSSISAYADPGDDDLTEDDAVATIEDESVEEVTGRTYGPLKVLCEQAIEAAMPGRTTIMRPGLIVGPEDGTDRFTYWPIRVAQGGEVMAPGSQNDPVQIVDVRDLAGFCAHSVDQQHTEVFNVCGPAGTMTVSMMLHGCWAVSGGETTFTWVPAEFLEQHNVAPWAHMTVWVPPGSEFDGFGTTNNTKAIAHGLTFRPLADTVRDTISWFRNEPADAQKRLAPEAEYATAETPAEERASARRAGLSAARERAVLDAWHAEGA